MKKVWSWSPRRTGYLLERPIIFPRRAFIQFCREMDRQLAELEARFGRRPRATGRGSKWGRPRRHRKPR